MCVIGDVSQASYGLDVDSMIERITEDHSNVVYFHNLRFDGGFVTDWLLRNGYHHRQDKPAAGEFSTLISDMGRWYSITVKWENGNKTEFRDSYKKLPMSVADVAKAFDLEESKGDIDYHKPRPVGYEPTPEEWDYLRRDFEIIAHALKEEFDHAMKGLTVGADSLKEYKALTFSKTFDKRFPVLDYDTDADIRRAYRGGFTYADPRHTQQVTRSGITLDVNSLYPFIMHERLLPFGRPLRRKGLPLPDDDYPLTVFTVTFTAKLKPNHIPCIQVKGTPMFAPTEYLTEITDPTTLTVTNVDWDLFNEHYDIEVESYDNGYAFKAARGMFDTYVDKWTNVKANSDGGRRAIAKLHLNSLYGKFATNPRVTGKFPSMENDAVKLTLGPEEIRDPVYTPVGAFVTAWARDLTIRAAQANYDTFAYADTDSLHLLRDDVPDGINVHPTELGAWDHEYSFRRAFYIRAKAYLEETHEGVKVNRIAGVPRSVSDGLSMDDVHDGMVLHGKLVPRAVPGGVVLKDVPYELKF